MLKHAETFGNTPYAPIDISTIVVGTSEAELPMDAIREAHPELTIVHATGDDIAPHLATADAFIGFRLTSDQIEAAPRLKWLHILTAGVEHIVNPILAERNIIVTNASGVHAVNISEHVLAMMLAFGRGFPRLMRDQVAHHWRERHDLNNIFELQNQTLLIVGMGAIGLAVAERAKGFGMRIIGVRRSIPDSTPEGIDRVVRIADLDTVLPEADHVVICLPHTEETRGMFSRERLQKFKDGAYIYNIGRGATVDQDALIELLNAGKIAGAGLDVVTPEPLPSDSPLWDMESVIITAHTSGLTPQWLARAAPIVAENVRRLLSGEPVLNQVDVRSGY